MPRRTLSLFALAGLLAVAACSSADPSTFGASKKKATSTDSPGSFGTGDNDPGATGATGVCAPAKGQAEIPGNKCDDDDDGTVDNAATCDAALTNDLQDFYYAICTTKTNGAQVSPELRVFRHLAQY